MRQQVTRLEQEVSRLRDRERELLRQVHALQLENRRLKG